MASLARGRKKRVVLDIGSSAVRYCELAQTKNGYQLTRYIQREFDSDPSLDEETRRDMRRHAVLEILKEGKVRRKKTIFGVPGQSVFTRSRALPPVPEYKVTQIVKYEIQQQIPFSLDQIAMDYQVLDRTEAGGYEVMMAAIKVDVVDKHLDVLTEAKRSIDVVDVNSLAAYNWLKHSGEFGDGTDCVALIDMGAATTDIVIEREGKFRFTRPLNIGGNDITRALASGFGMTYQDAERLKRERGFAPTGDAERDGKGGEVIGQVLQRFVGEVMRSFAYFRSLPGGGQVNRVIMCGGGACLRNIIPYMQRSLNLEVRIAQPLAGLAIAPSAQQVNDAPEQACVVLGLALRCVDTVPLEINLVPPRILEAARQKEQAFLWASSLVALALIMASVIPMKAKENEVNLSRIDTLKRYITRYDPEMAIQIKQGQPIPQSMTQQALMQARRTITGLQEDVNKLDEAKKDRNFWLDEFALVSDARPETGGLWFATIETAQIGAAARGGAGGGGNNRGGRPAPQANRGGLGGGLLGRAAAGGGGGAGLRGRGGANNSSVPVNPFPGIEQGEVLGGAGGRARGGGNAGGGLGLRARGNNNRGGGGPAGGNRGRQNQNQGPVRAVIPEPNGVQIHGFAETDKVITDYVESLKAAERTRADGSFLSVSKVHMDESNVRSVFPQILVNAPVDGYSGQGAQDAGVVNPNAAQTYYSFSLQVEFKVSDTRPAPGGGGNAGNRGGGNQGRPNVAQNPGPGNPAAQ
jgi:type IV pilus assembly protein PilM